MKINKVIKYKLSKYYLKVILFFVLISFPVLIIANMYILDHFQKKYTEEIYLNGKNEMASVASVIDEKINEVKYIFIDCQRDVMFAPYVDYSSQSQIIKKNIMGKLDYYTTMNRYIDEVCFHNSQNNYILISNYGIVSENSEQYDKISNRILNASQSGIHNISHTHFSSKNHKHYISMIIRLSSTNQLSNYLDVSIAIGDLMNEAILETGPNNEKVSNYYIVDENNKIVYNNDNSLINDIVDFSNITENGKISDIYSLNNIRWVLVRETDLGILSKKLNELRVRVLITSFAALAIMLLFIVFASLYLYSPVKSIMAIIKKSTSGEASNEETKSEFDYITSILKKHISKNDNLTQELKQSKVLLEKALLYDLIRYKYKNNVDVSKYLKNYVSGYYTVFLMNNIDSHLEKEKVELIFNDNDSGLMIYTFKENSGRLICLVTSQDNNLDKIAPHVLQTMENCGQGLERMKISVGGIYKSIEEINRSYVEALYCFNFANAFDDGQRTLVEFNTISKNLNTKEIDTANIIKLKSSIECCDLKKAEAIIEEIFYEKTNILEYNYNFFIVISLLSELFDGDNAMFLNKVNSSINGKEMLNINFIKRFLKENIATIISRKKITGKRSNHADKIVEYISNNYMVDVSLDDIASYLGISKPYVCKIMKKNLNCAFSDYINKFRIEKAQKLMENSGYNGDLFKQIGYSSSSYFIQVFKKYTGMTPVEYNKQVMRKIV